MSTIHPLMYQPVAVIPPELHEIWTRDVERRHVVRRLVEGLRRLRTGRATRRRPERSAAAASPTG